MMLLLLMICSLTFTPFEDAVCTKDGSVFDIMSVLSQFNCVYFCASIVSISFLQLLRNVEFLFGYLWYRNIIPYIRKYGRHPVTGAPLKQDDLIPLTFHKNSEGKIFELTVVVGVVDSLAMLFPYMLSCI